MRFWLMALVACGGNDVSFGTRTQPPTLGTDIDPVSDPSGPSPLRDTDGDGTVDSEDDDIDGDGVLNQADPDPDGDGIPGYSLPYDPADDPDIDPGTGLPVLEIGSARGRVCAPNETTWVAGADVTIITPGGGFSTTTNGEGWWQVDGLPAGTFEVIITKGSFYLAYTIEVLDGQITSDVFDECLNQGDLSVAVLSGEWDNIDAVLDSLAISYDAYDGNIQGGAFQQAEVDSLLTDPSRLAQYDVLFLNCGIMEHWVNGNQAVVSQTLRDYVLSGGSIYASDWSYYAVEAAFPDKIGFFGDDGALGAAREGERGFSAGVVVDPAMANILGSNEATINFDLSRWVAMDVVDPSVDVLVQSNDFVYRFESGQPEPTEPVPLSVRFTEGAGRVIYTSFHNEVQATDDMHKMLEEIVLSL